MVREAGLDMKNIVLLTLTLHAWGNRRKASLAGIEVKADKNALHLTKRLVDSPEYSAILTYQEEVKAWCRNRSMPSFIRPGVLIVKRDMVDTIEEGLRAAEKRLDGVVDAFITEYPAQVDEARVALNGYFNEADYPPPVVLREKFGFEWSWFKINVPDNLPEEVRKQEEQKLRKAFKDASDEIVAALRESFQQLLSEAIERLGDTPDGKPRVFRDSFVVRLNEFFDTFEARNLMEDEALASVVAQAKALIGDASPERLRKRKAFRTEVLTGFERAKKVVDQLVEDAPRRKFNMEDD